MPDEDMATVEQLPTTRKGRATRARIVETASSLVFEHGVAGTSLDEVGTVAGVGKSQLYHYFADKATLVRAVVDHQADGVLAAQEPELSQLDTWQAWADWRDALVNMQLDRHCRGGCPIGSLVPELVETDELARLRIVEGFERWEAAFRGGLARMRNDGLLRADADVAALAVAVLAAVQGGLLLCQVRRDVAALETALDAAIHNLRSYAAT